MVRNQVAVGYNYFGAIAGGNFAGPYANIQYGARATVHLNDIAHLNRFFEGQYQPRNQVVHNVLQAETNTYTKRADNDGYFINRHTRCGHRQEKAHSYYADTYKQGRGAVFLFQHIHIMFMPGRYI